MSDPTRMWRRLRDEVRSASDRTRRGARRAFDSGVLRVDLVSLRRRRRRILSDLGERLLDLWEKGSLAQGDRDPESLRLRALLGEVDAVIAAKEAELRRVRTDAEEASTAPASPSATPES